MEETIIWIVITIFVTTYKIIEIKGDISWKLQTKPAIFGRDVQLLCHLTNTTPCCNRYTRKWAKGWKYNLAIINGVSLNNLKYIESVNNSANTSIFTIKTLKEDDVNIPYECTYGFNTFSAVLEMTEEDFEYHPIEELPINITYYKDYIEANISMEKVYPSPKCNATDGKKTKYPKKKKTEFVFVAIATFIVCAGLVGIIALSLILLCKPFATIDQSRGSPSESFLAIAETEA